MKKEEMRRWLSDRLMRQSRLTMGAFGAMTAIGFIATIMEFGLFYLIIRIGFIGSGFLSALVTLGILAALQFVTWLRIPKQLPDMEHDAELDSGPVQVVSAPNMTAVWTYSLGSLETDQTWVERLLGLLSLPQRMCSAAWFTWNRIQELKTVSVEHCAAVIRLLHREDERVSLKQIAELLKTDEIGPTIRQLSLIDGVVFLTREDAGLRLANRLTDDLAEWQKNQSPTA